MKLLLGLLVALALSSFSLAAAAAHRTPPTVIERDASGIMTYHPDIIHFVIMNTDKQEEWLSLPYGTVFKVRDGLGEHFMMAFNDEWGFKLNYGDQGWLQYRTKGVKSRSRGARFFDLRAFTHLGVVPPAHE